MLLGSGIGAVVTSLLDAQAVAQWGWRLPFCFGIVVGLTGLYIRRQISESVPVGLEGSSHAPIAEAFRTQWRTC
jgi:MHS family proline/betaine transporter-like MFS transporter